MIEHIVILREQLDREREERNYFQLERDKIHSFWDVTKKQLKEVVAQLRNEEKKIEEDEGRHLVEIKVGNWKSFCTAWWRSQASILLRVVDEPLSISADFGHILWKFAGNFAPISNSTSLQSVLAITCKINCMFPWHQVYKQKMKHLLYEHHNSISELESERVTTAEVREKEQAQLERELQKRTAAIRNDMHQLDIENLVSELEQVRTSIFFF